MEVSRFFDYEKDLPSLRKRVRVRSFGGLLVCEGKTHRRHQSLFERTLQRLPV